MGAPVEIDCKLIRPREDARQIQKDTVNELKVSIERMGLLSPILVREANIYLNPGWEKGYELIAGRHRHRAVQELGWKTIPANIIEADDLNAELAMIDENLCRSDLSPSERAACTARRKVIYEAQNPEAANGTNQHSRVGKVCQPNFAEATASATGQSDRKVRLDAERGEKVSPEAIAIIQGTKLDKGSYLDKLKGLPREQQAEVAKNDLVAPAPEKTDRKAEQRDMFWKMWAKLDDDVRQELHRQLKALA